MTIGWWTNLALCRRAAGGGQVGGRQTGGGKLAVGKLAQTASEFPPMAAPASFNLEAVKARIEKMNQHEGR